MPRLIDRTHEIGGLCKTSLDIRETSDAGCSWSEKPTLTFDPPFGDIITVCGSDTRPYVTETGDPGMTRLGTFFTREYLEEKLDELGISQDITSGEETYYSNREFVRELGKNDRNPVTPTSMSRADIAKTFHANSIRAISGKRRNSEPEKSYCRIYWQDDLNGFEIKVSKTNLRDFVGERLSIMIPGNNRSVTYTYQPPDPSTEAQSLARPDSCQ